MDDQNQPNSQLNNQPKKEQTDVSSSAPVEMEPETQNSMPTTPPTPATPNTQPMNEPVMGQEPETPTPLPAPEKPEGLLEAPKKKNTMYMVLIVVVLVIALGFLGYMVYKTLYP